MSRGVATVHFMAELAVIRGAVGAWLATLIAAMVALLTAAVLPRWVNVTDGVTRADVGLWQTCRPYGSIYNCTRLNSRTTTGQRLRPPFQSICKLVLADSQNDWERYIKIQCGVNLGFGAISV